MRKAGFVINGKGVNGYWHDSKLTVGDLYQLRRSEQWMMVEDVHDGTFDAGEGEGYFYSLRPATQAEIDAYNASKPQMSAAEVQALLDRIDYIGS